MTKKQNKKDLREELISRYMQDVLENGQDSTTVYSFCKSYGFSEEDFYANFGSLKGIQQAVWEAFYNKTQDLLNKNKEFGSFSNKDKMLSFFYTFFELLTLNRSYVLSTIDHTQMLGKMTQLKGLRTAVKGFAKDLIEDANSEQTFKFSKRNPQLFSEAAWWHFLFLLKFWADDNSAGFEKTDMAIEKSVTTVFDLFENTPLESVIDFGKFLYKENIA